MNVHTSQFEAERPRLTALCYRMLGELASAEDVVQETWLRWQNVHPQEIRDPAAWLRRAATNIAIDTLRSARHRRETYVGPWLPEPLIACHDQPVEEQFELAQECELALLWAMERLGPEDRAIFILREAFDASYREIAETVGKSEAACRQAVSRAHRHLETAGPRFDAPEHEVEALVSRFFAAVAAEDFVAIKALFAPDAIAISDGGRKARAARRVLEGPDEIVHVLMSVWRKAASEPGWCLEPARANLSPAALRRVDGRIDSVITLAPDSSGQIGWLYVMRNPDKLAS